MEPAVVPVVPVSGHPDPADESYAFATQGVEDPHALNLPSVVEGLVRSFAAQVMDIREGWVAGTVEPGAAVESIVAAASGLNAVFMGEAPEYRTQPWNSPEQLGEYLVGECHLEAAPERAVETLAEIFAQHLIAVTGYGALGLWPTELVLEDMKRSVQVFQAALMGVPQVPPTATPEEPHPPLIIPGAGRG